ncbi:MAG: P-loop NTPase [Desulfobacter sp.]|nr:MAG: P-loop NTPase [Desulfobacter sp.]
MKLMICGKGGSGKSTVSALLAKAMEKQGCRVLLVDADESNMGLYKMMGTQMPQPLMDALGGKKGFQAKLRSAGTGLGAPPPLFPGPLTIQGLEDNELTRDCLARSGTVRILSTGKIHHFGEGCACPMGNLFRLFFSALDLEENDRVIVDTAAGLEHFGRRLDGQCDRILAVVDPSYESLTMSRRMAAIAGEAGLPFSLVLNKVTPNILPDLEAALDGLALLGALPMTPQVFSATLRGEPLESNLPEMDALCRALNP